ncbi:MAG: FtsW/RodA/SpoVE family cell cycle protein [Elusimicrobiaceae bacterium]|nr:FtsW/RodA/SpoVE family cell cycle protein [Elusimicrobiaceae bacterium]
MFNNSPKIKTRKLDWPLIYGLIGLCLIGFFTILSAVSGTKEMTSIMRTHIIALPIAVAAFVFGWLFNYQIYAEHYKKLYVFVIFLLVAVLAFGIVARGSHSWFRFGGFSFQPAELCRIALIVITAAFLAGRPRQIKNFKTLAIFSAFILPVFGLIMMQPDFSSIVVTAPALLILLFVAGVNVYYFVLIIAFGLMAGIFPIIWTYISLYPEILDNSIILSWVNSLSFDIIPCMIFSGVLVGLFVLAWFVLRYFRVLVPFSLTMVLAFSMVAGFFSGYFVNKHIKSYQRKRVEAFLAPSADPKGASYNVLQAQIAMGSGGVLGKGLFSGTQSRLGFVPERHTDFILAILGEENGLLGTLLVLSLYILILWRIIIIARNSSDLFGYLLCAGIFAIFFVYMAFNFGMLIGIVPVAGIPLPFISYGGSNLVSSMWALGLVEGVYFRRLSLI